MCLMIMTLFSCIKVSKKLKNQYPLKIFQSIVMYFGHEELAWHSEERNKRSKDNSFDPASVSQLHGLVLPFEKLE